MRLPIFLIFILVFADISYSQNNTTKRTQIGNNNLSVILPKGFLQSKKSSNIYVNPNNAISLFIYDIQQMGLNKYLEQLSDDYFQKEGLTVIESYNASRYNLTGYIFECNITLDTLLFNRLFYITGSEKETYLYMANYPAMVDSIFKPQLIESMKSLNNE